MDAGGTDAADAEVDENEGDPAKLNPLKSKLDVESPQDELERNEQGDEAEEDDPQNGRPVLHDGRVEHELLHDSLVHVGELQADEEARRPHEVIVQHDLGLGVDLALTALVGS